MEPIIEIKNIYKNYGSREILHGVSFNIMPYDVLAFLGPNGSGKTTTFRIISRLSNYNSGEVIINRQYYAKNTDLQFVFDQPILYEELTGREHLNFVCEINKHIVNKKTIQNLVNEFEVSEYLEERIATYSLGMKKKVQLMCALVLDPKVILLDEYISGLDPIGLFMIKKILKDFAKKGNAVVISTHMLDVAETFCNRAIIIREGKILKEEDNLQSIKSRYKSLEEYFISSVLNE